MPTIFPFTAIVGQDRMRRALVLNAVNPRIGGVLIRGERGTAKSTAARALAALLPRVKVVSGCRFGCDPDQPMAWCTECKERAEKGGPLPVDYKSTPFVNLPVSATEDRVVGTLDIERPSSTVNGISSRACWRRPTAACSTSTRSTCWTTTWWMCCSTRPRWE